MNTSVIGQNNIVIVLNFKLNNVQSGISRVNQEKTAPYS